MSVPFVRRRPLAPALSCALVLALPFLAQAAEPAAALQEITVTGTREGELRSETPASVSLVKGGTLEAVKPSHPTEIMNRVPGAVVLPTTGEGHTTGIRQPIGTDPVYLFLEDGIPIRSTGFFNHNALYETNIPQADGIEVVRGPGSSLYGSDAIGGIVNVLTKAPSAKPEARTSFEAGSYGWGRFLGSASDSFGNTGIRGDVNLTHSDGWRHATDYDRQSATFRVDQLFSSGATLKTVLSGTNIDQRTGANSRLSKSDYENNPKLNTTPIAFREVKALRLSTAYEVEDKDSLLSITPYARWNEMDLLPSWQLSYDPVVTTTGHSSLGMLARWRKDFAPWRTRLVLGGDFDYSPGRHEEWRLNTTRTGKVYTAYSLAQKVYDYDVTFMQASPYVHAETSPLEPLRLTGGLRFDVMAYDYDNKLSTTQTGNWRRPEDAERRYTHLSPALGATWAFSPALNAFANYKHAFRVPSEGQIFRQGGSVDTIHLKPVKADSVEAGLRGPDKGDLTWEISVYHMVKRDDVLTSRDPAGRTATNAGRTEHTGIEAAASWRFLPEWSLGGAWSLARHRYESWLSANGDYSGKEISSAPKLTGSLVLGWQPAVLKGGRVEGEWVHMGGYWLDEANTARYGGHELFNLRASYEMAGNLSLFGRVMNLTDARWATTGALTNGLEEYAPGLPRTFIAGFTARF